MSKHRKNSYDVSVWTPDTTFWFQRGKLTENKDVNWVLDASSHKSFRTRKKLLSFLRWLEIAHPNARVEVGEFQKDKRYVFRFNINGKK
jgi:hypothetical protein